MKKVIALMLAIVMVAAMLPTSVFALSGTAEYSPAESNISGKYWVTLSASEGDAALAADDDLATAWTWTSYPAVLTVDLSGAYDAIRKIETVFADDAAVYEYIIEGSADGADWTVLADKTGNDTVGANYTDIFAYEGLRYVKLTVLSGTAGVKEFKIINYLREDMNNGSDSSTVSWSNSYYYNAGNNPPVEGVRGGQLTPETMETGDNFFGLVKDLGWDTTRIRVWNEPKSEGNWRYAGDINEAIDYENWPSVSNSATSCSPDAQAEYAKYIVGAGQELAIDFHYSDSWSDPQNQPKPYAWAHLEFDELVDTVYDFTYDYIKRLIDQGTAPSIVALGNEITNGMLWGSEYLEVNEFADYHDYYKRFIRDNSAENMGEDGRTIDGTKINPDATEGGGVKWVKYAEANGDTESEAYKEFLDSINNLAQLVDAGNRAIAALNEEYDLDIQTEMHFAFNVIEQPRNGDKVVLEEEYVFNKVMTLITNLSEDLEGMGGMVDRIGVSYYPDWHGKYETVQRNIVEMSKLLPDVEFNIAECSPAHSGRVNTELDNPNYPVGTQFSPQMAGDIAIEIMKVINDVPNNAGQGVWPWNGQSVYGTGRGANSTLQASFKAWNDAFAKNVVESSISAATLPGVAPVLPETVKSLDVATGEITDVEVIWDEIDPSAYARTGTFTVNGKAVVTVPEEGRGKAMDSVTATVSVVRNVSVGAVVADSLTAACGEGEAAVIDVSYVGEEVTSVRVAIDSALPIASIDSEYVIEYNPDNGYIVVYSLDGSAISGTLFTITYDLDVYPWYANGEYPVYLEVIDASDSDAENVNIGAISGMIVLDNDYAAGDVTLDGIVTNADLVAIARYLVDLVEFNELQLEIADVDGDYEVDNSDLIKVARGIVEGERIDEAIGSYTVVVEGYDWGAASTKLIVDLNREIEADSVEADDFNILNTMQGCRGSSTSTRRVTDAYVSDAEGNEVTEDSNYVAIELYVSPNEGGAFYYNFSGSGHNVWPDPYYFTIDIASYDGIKYGGVVINKLTLGQDPAAIVCPLADEFVQTEFTSSDDIVLNYGAWSPEADNAKNPLIIWLHGAGEGGTDNDIVAMGNKVVNLITDDIQQYFTTEEISGAYVLTPQSPTMWMNDGSGNYTSDGSSMYTEALMELIEAYVAGNPDIDTNRIYIGGCSNGGYMTMNMIMTYPEYFAAAYPICEAYTDEWITDAQIEAIVDIPIWFTHAANDTTVRPGTHTLATYERLIEAGAADVHLSYFDDVHDTTGTYFRADGSPYQYQGHWSWIYTLNNECVEEDGTTIMEWLASQTKA